MPVKRPPGPRDGLFGLRLVSRIKADPLAFYADVHREFGDAAFMRFGPYPEYVFFHPDQVRELLAEKAKQFIRFQPPIRVLRQWNGDGLLMTEGEVWLRHRRIIQPAFHPSRFTGYADLMAAAAREHLDRLSGEVEFEREMTDLTMDVATRTLFGVDLGAGRAELAEPLKVLNAVAMREFMIPFAVPRWWPGQGPKWRAARTLDGTVRRVIADRRATGDDRGDLLSILLKATDEEGDGKGLTDEQARDHTVNLFLAGHDTAAAGMTWIGWALAAHPEVAARAAAEVDEVLGQRDPAFADLAKLKYVERVVKEALRHRPAAIGVFGRQALADVEVGGWPIPKGAVVRVLSWVTHHDPRWFPDPEKFDPDRFAPGRAEAIPPGAYFPFGMGPRVCIGNAFAMTEMTLLTAMLLRRFTLSLAPGQGEPVPVAGMSLRPAVRPYHDGMAKPGKPAEPTVTFWGAAGTVTGSMHLLAARGKHVLLDCGLYQGRRADSHARNREFPFRPKKVDAVVLSHAHVDHCGNLPNLVRQGFSGPIYCTPATRALAAVMLGDAAKIQQEDASYLNRKADRGEPKVEPLYDARDVYRTLLKLKAVAYCKPFEVLPGIEATFSDAGHLLGSAAAHLRVGGRSITFTGDRGRPGLPILRDPEPLPPADLVIAESTYGGHTHEPVDETAARLGEVVRRTAARGGKVVIPAFSVGRTQTVVYFLHQLMTAGALPPIPIYVDSPMAVRATEVFQAHPECFDEETARLLAEHPEVFGEGRVRYVEKVHESVALNRVTEPCVIISASGMCEAGRILHHLKHNLHDARNAVLIVGYQADGTLGRRLVERRPEVRVLGRAVPVKAEVVVLNGLSSHADHPGMVASLAPLAGPGVKVRLVHGEPDRAAKLADALRAAGFADVAAPVRGESVAV